MKDIEKVDIVEVLRPTPTQMRKKKKSEKMLKNTRDTFNKNVFLKIKESGKVKVYDYVESVQNFNKNDVVLFQWAIGHFIRIPKSLLNVISNIKSIKTSYEVSVTDMIEGDGEADIMFRGYVPIDGTPEQILKKIIEYMFLTESIHFGFSHISQVQYEDAYCIRRFGMIIETNDGVTHKFKDPYAFDNIFGKFIRIPKPTVTHSCIE